MKVSIITVCKNAENAIKRTILSVVTQNRFANKIEYLIIIEEFFKIISDNIINKQLLCDHKVSTKHIDQIISVFLNDGISSTNKELYLQERKIFQAKYFSKDEIKEIEKHLKKSETIKQRQKNKSILHFQAKVLMKIHELWVNR